MRNLGSVRKGEQVPDGKKTSLTAKFTKKNGQAQS